MRGPLPPLASELLQPAVSLAPYATVEDASRLLGEHEGCFLNVDDSWWDVAPRDLVGVPHTRRLIEVSLKAAAPLLVSSPVSEATFAVSQQRPVFDGRGALAGQVSYRALLDYHRITDEIANLALAVRSLVHDFNNVLLLGHAALDDGDTERSRGVLHELQALVQRIAVLQGGRDAPWTIDIRAFLEDVASQLATLTQLEIRVEANGAGGIATKPGVLRRVLLNLCLNAKKAGATLVRLESALAGSSVTLRVLDDGPGFTAHSVTRAFVPGYSTSGGVGLGLPTVKRLIEGLGGSVRLEPTPGEGRVELVLPRSA